MENLKEMGGLEALKYCYAHRDAYAREWKAQGGKIVGYFCNSVPEEFIIAAGFLPYRVSGDPAKPVIPAAREGQPTDGGLTSMVSLVMDGTYSFLDYLIVPRSKSSVQGACLKLEGTKAKNPDAPFPEVYNYVRSQTSFTTALDFDRWSMGQLKDRIGEWAGKPVTDEALKEAIKVCNETRALLKELEAKRAEDSLPVSGTDALQMIAPAMFMDKREYNRLLREALDELPARPDAGRVRVMVGGGPKDNLQLYEIIESCGATVVSEDHCWGNRYSDDPVDEKDPDPTNAIFRRYIYLKGCSYVYPLKSRTDTSVRAAKTGRAEAAVFSTYLDDTVAWDVPEEIKAVRELGVKTVYLQKQPYTITDPEAVRAAVNELVAGCGQG